MLNIIIAIYPDSKDIMVSHWSCLGCRAGPAAVANVGEAPFCSKEFMDQPWLASDGKAVASHYRKRTGRKMANHYS